MFHKAFGGVFVGVEGAFAKFVDDGLFFGAFEEDEEFFGFEDWREGEGEAVENSELVGGGVGNGAVFLEGGETGEERGGVAVGADAEDDEVKGVLWKFGKFVFVFFEGLFDGEGGVEKMGGVGLLVGIGEEGFADEFLVGVGVGGGDVALIYLEKFDVVKRDVWVL